MLSQWLGLRQPKDLCLPPADLVIIDESAIEAMIRTTSVDPANLTLPGTYAAPPGEEDLIQEAVDLGHAVVSALPNHVTAVRALADAKITPDLLRRAANAADEAARETRPRITAGMTTTDITKQMRRFEPHSGTAVAAVMRQLAHDIETGRPASIGVEWDAEVRATTEQGGVTVCHSLIRWHGLAEAFAIPATAGLLLIDADANLEINRRLFGPDLHEVRINALRQTFTSQISDAALGDCHLTYRHSTSGIRYFVTAQVFQRGQAIRRSSIKRSG